MQGFLRWHSSLELSSVHQRCNASELHIHGSSSAFSISIFPSISCPNNQGPPTFTYIGSYSLSFLLRSVKKKFYILIKEIIYSCLVRLVQPALVCPVPTTPPSSFAQTSLSFPSPSHCPSYAREALLSNSALTICPIE